MTGSALACLALSLVAPDTAPWPAEQAWRWSNRLPWLVGCNYVTSTAVNDVEMWEAKTFDPVTIDRELGWAEGLGFNTLRVFVNYVCWQSDAAGLKQRFGQFLDLADRHGLSVMPVLFDDCAFGDQEPHAGPQLDPVPGVHNSRWVPSPGLKLSTDPAAWDGPRGYVRDMVTTFGHDRRIVLWDLYNEPGNSGLGTRTQPLVEAAFAWAREATPTQPLTAGVWGGPRELSRRQLELSDVVSFHCYGSVAALQNQLPALQATGRPVVCTEWMHRHGGGRFATHLPVFRSLKIGCWSWGLVAGRTQTYFPWGSKPGAPEPEVWFHDLFRRDGTPLDAGEIATIRRLTAPVPGQRRTLVATAEHAAVTWRMTLTQPAGEWTARDYDDHGWTEAPAPFGTAEPAIGRTPRTVWDTTELWLRREFELPAPVPAGLSLRVQHDEDAEIWLNGVLAARLAGFNAGYDIVEIEPAAATALRAGRNVMAVHVKQTVGGQYFDLGLEAPEL